MKQAAELITLMIDDRDETFLLFILIDEQLKGLFGIHIIITETESGAGGKHCSYYLDRHNR
jgi:hypothetical protein